MERLRNAAARMLVVEAEPEEGHMTTEYDIVRTLTGATAAVA